MRDNTSIESFNKEICLLDVSEYDYDLACYVRHTYEISRNKIGTIAKYLIEGRYTACKS